MAERRIVRERGEKERGGRDGEREGEHERERRRMAEERVEKQRGV
jgi:hypothetical protein